MQAGLHILVPVDGSLHSDRAVAQAVRIAAAGKNRIDLLYVAYFDQSTDDAVTKISWLPGSVAGSTGKLSRTVLQRAAALIPSEIEQTQQVRTGIPAKEILAFAQMQAVDLIVVGARGLGRVAGFLLGSVSQELLEQAPCAVLVVK